jgi:hypothetical protein
MIDHQKLRVGTEKPYDNRNAKDIVSLRLKKCGTVRLYRITKDIAISGIAIASFCCSEIFSYVLKLTKYASFSSCCNFVSFYLLQFDHG